jgi:lysophospholipase L1-like esterase
MNHASVVTGKLAWVLVAMMSSAGIALQTSAQAPAADAVPIPDVVAIPRPTAAEVEVAERALARFVATADDATRLILDRYPGLLEVRVAPPNTAVIPNLAPFFQARHEANLEVAGSGTAELLFMGDSITDFWRNEEGPFAGKPVFDRYFGRWNIANFGIAGDTTQGVLYRLRNGEGRGFSPTAVMLMIGTNNTGRNTAAEIAEGIGAVVLQLQRDFPDARILLLGVFPRGRANDPVRNTIATINDIIARLHDGDRVHFLDIGAEFLDADGNIPADVMSDALHPSTRGYELWAEAVIDHLSALMGGNAPARN